MSSILKALRKIEEEKRVASHSAPDLRMDQGHSPRQGWPFLPLAVGILLGALCVGLVSFWSSSNTPVVVTQPMQQPIRTGVESKQTGIVSERKPLSEVAAPETLVTTATEAPKAQLSAIRAPTVDPVAVKPGTLPEGVRLKVSETFYHEDPANGMAVVNDLPVMIGTFVDSAMVLEIHANKVVFSIDDDTYDIPVTANQQP